MDTQDLANRIRQKIAETNELLREAASKGISVEVSAYTEELRTIDSRKDVDLSVLRVKITKEL